jgi:hypothetical protein
MNALLFLLPMLLVWIVGSFFGLGPVRARRGD